jgi:hypothetical protein
VQASMDSQVVDCQQLIKGAALGTRHLPQQRVDAGPKRIEAAIRIRLLRRLPARISPFALHAAFRHMEQEDLSPADFPALPIPNVQERADRFVALRGIEGGHSLRLCLPENTRLSFAQ